jgi:hypothetical protein
VAAQRDGIFLPQSSEKFPAHAAFIDIFHLISSSWRYNSAL